MLKIGNFEIEKTKIVAIIGLDDKTAFLNEIAKENNISDIKTPRFFNVKKALKNNYNHEYVKALNFDTSKKIKDLNIKDRYLFEFLFKIFNQDTVLLDEPFSYFNDEIKDKMFKIMKASNKTCIIASNNLDNSKYVDYAYLLKNNKLTEYKEVKSKYIKITGKSINKALFPLKDMKIDHFNSHEIEFVFNGNINNLTPYLAKIEIDSLEIRNLELAEIYKYYYKK